jgi:hypothetical protein
MILWFQIFKIHHTDGVVVQDNNDTYTYPMPMYARNDVFVGRICLMKARQTH